MKKFQEFGDKCWNVTSSMSGIIMFLVSIMIIINVILRRFTSVSIVGCNELVRYFMCVAASIALMQNEWVDGNVRVSIILDILKGRAGKALDFACYLLTSVGFILITYFMVEQAVDTFRKGTLTTDLLMPLWIFTGILALCFVLLTVVFWMRTVIKGYALFRHAEDETADSR